MTRPATVTATEIKRTVKAVIAAGVDVRGVEVRPDGTVKVLVGAAEADNSPTGNTWDRVLSR